MIADNPMHLTCPWCPAQAYKKHEVYVNIPLHTLLVYECPARHTFLIEAEDASFNFGHKEDNE